MKLKIEDFQKLTNNTLVKILEKLGYRVDGTQIYFNQFDSTGKKAFVGIKEVRENTYGWFRFEYLQLVADALNEDYDAVAEACKDVDFDEAFSFEEQMLIIEDFFNNVNYAKELSLEEVEDAIYNLDNVVVSKEAVKEFLSKQNE